MKLQFLKCLCLILNILACDCGKIMCTVQLSVSTGQKWDIQLMVDTGLAVSILPMSIYTVLFNQAPFSPPPPPLDQLSLVSFGGDAIEVKGCLLASISYVDHFTTADLYIVRKGSAVLARDLFTGLCLQLCDDQVSTAQCAHPVSSVAASSEQTGMCKRICASCQDSA